MAENLTLVTAFFDVGRGNWKEKVKRDSQKYCEFFAHWCHIKNDLIVYVDDDSLVEIIRKLRSEVENYRTEVVYVDNVYNLNTEIYECFNNANYNASNNYRLLPRNFECISVDYNYVTALKFEVLKRAVDTFRLTGNVAWIDFGFDHGGVLYDRDFFNRHIQYEGNKICLYSFVPEDELKTASIIDMVLKMETFIQGSFFICPTRLVNVFVDDAYTSIKELTAIDLMDDDQIFYLMAYRKHSENFNIVQLPVWHSCFIYMTKNIVLENETKVSIIKRIYRVMFKLKYAFRVFLHMNNFDWPK